MILHFVLKANSCTQDILVCLTVQGTGITIIKEKGAGHKDKKIFRLMKL